jgi:hypothetical protein
MSSLLHQTINFSSPAKKRVNHIQSKMKGRLSTTLEVRNIRALIESHQFSHIKLRMLVYEAINIKEDIHYEQFPAKYRSKRNNCTEWSIPGHRCKELIIVYTF